MDSNCKAKLSLDHVYCHPNDGTYIRSSSGPTEMLTILKENKQLKAMLLLHLDLIQEQSDQLTAKEKLLASLREENESLKLRLDQVDKNLQSRACEPKEHAPPADSPSNVRKEVAPRVKVLGSEATIAARLPPPATETSHGSASFATDQSLPRTESKYKICDDSHTADSKSTGGEHNGKYITKIVLQRVQSPEGKASAGDDRNSEKEVKVPQASPGPSNVTVDRKHFDKDEPFGRCYSESIDDTFSCASGSEFGSVSAYSQRRRIVKCGNLTTKQLYKTREWLTDQVDEDLDQEETEALQVENPNLEIPKWTVKEFHGLYTIEGTEDLSDEVFMKRHSKLEIEEKRRKRWDAQRIREQRNIERLKRRQSKGGPSSADDSKPLSSFYPSPDSIKFIEITEDIPVTAFGEVIPRLKPEPFSLPWPDPSEAGTSSAGAFDWPSTSAGAAAPMSCSSSISSATGTGESTSQRTRFPCFGPETCFKLVKRRRRQPSQSTSYSRRTDKKNCD